MLDAGHAEAGRLLLALVDHAERDAGHRQLLHRGARDLDELVETTHAGEPTARETVRAARPAAAPIARRPARSSRAPRPSPRASAGSASPARAAAPRRGPRR